MFKQCIFQNKTEAGLKLLKSMKQERQ